MMHEAEKNDVLKFKLLEAFTVSFFLLFITYNLFFGQKININSGLGWDGSAIFNLLKNFSAILNTRTCNFYDVQHIFPNMGFYIVAKIFYIPMTDKAFLRGGIITNYIFMLIALIFFYLCMKRFKSSVRVIAFCGMFLNFASLKFSGYQVLLPDVGAFSLSLLLLYSYLKEYKTLFLLISFAGSFTYPTFALLGLLLFCFDLNARMKKIINFNYYYIPILITTVIGFSSVAITLYYYQLFGTKHSSIPTYLSIIFDYAAPFFKFIYSPPNIKAVLTYMTSINYQFYLFSLIALLCYMFYVQKKIFENTSIKEIIYQMKLKKALIYIILVYGGIFSIRHFFCSGASYSVNQYFFTITYEAVVNPMCFLVMHFIYYGPIILLFLIYSKEFIACIKKSSPGLFLFTVFSFIIAIDSESRHLMNIMPILIFFLGRSINDNKKIIEKLTPRFLGVFVGVSLFISCFWYKIRLSAQLPSITNTHYFQESAYQSYFMFQGPWVTYKMYAIFLAVFITLLTGFYIYLKTSLYEPKIKAMNQ